jgi:formylglycine-generating enzyme required for sulfatase activity
MAFCIWDSGRLPIEAEWEYAAAGGSENRLYPWGSAVADCTYANFNNVYYCSGGAGSAVGVGLTPKGNGRFGHADLAGNVVEWALDWFAYYPYSECVNCFNATDSGQRAVRGGSFSLNATDVRSVARYATVPEDHYSPYGLRCARAF